MWEYGIHVYLRRDILSYIKILQSILEGSACCRFIVVRLN